MKFYYKIHNAIVPSLIRYKTTDGNLDGIECQRDCLGNPLLFNRYGSLLARLLDGQPKPLLPATARGLYPSFPIEVIVVRVNNAV